MIQYQDVTAYYLSNINMAKMFENVEETKRMYAKKHYHFNHAHEVPIL